MIFKDKEVVIFDLDGTLVDSVPDLATSINYMLEILGYLPHDESVIRSWVGNGALALVLRALRGDVDSLEPIDDELLARAMEIFLKYYALNLNVSTTLYPDVVATLGSLKKRGYRLAIVTNKPYEFVEPILRALDIYEFFELFIGGDSLATKKPSAEPLLYVCNRLEVDTSKAIMIGDSKNDILSAKSAKIQTIALSYGYNYDEDISCYDPDVVFDHFKDILEVL